MFTDVEPACTLTVWTRELSSTLRTIPSRTERRRGRRQRRSFVFRLLRAKEREEKRHSKQQGGRAMATLDRQIPSPDTFLCEPWSSFVSAAKLRFVYSKFARRRHCCYCGQTVGKCVVQLSVIELSKLLHHAGRQVLSKRSKVTVKNITTKCSTSTLFGETSSQTSGRR